MAEAGCVITVQSAEQFKDLIKQATDSGKLAVLDFTATWCGPCRMMAPIFAEFAKAMPHIMFLKVDVDELKSIAEEYEVEAMPTFMFVKEGKVVQKVIGARKEDVQNAIHKHGGPAAAAAAASASA